MKNYLHKDVFDNSIQSFWANKAIQYLKKNIHEINSINLWSEKVGVSRVYLYSIIKNYYKVTPSKVLFDVRLISLKELIKNEPNITAYSAATSVGLKDEKALYKFLKSQYGLNFTKLRLIVFREEKIKE